LQRHRTTKRLLRRRVETPKERLFVEAFLVPKNVYTAVDEVLVLVGLGRSDLLGNWNNCIEKHDEPPLRAGTSIYEGVHLRGKSVFFDSIEDVLDGLFQLDQGKLYNRYTPIGLCALFRTYRATL